MIEKDHNLAIVLIKNTGYTLLNAIRSSHPPLNIETVYWYIKLCTKLNYWEGIEILKQIDDIDKIIFSSINHLVAAMQTSG